jgi:glycopeptide antibiotics resistance protein
MRANWQFFRVPMMHIENLELCTGLNIQHILIFAWIGILLRLAWPTSRWLWPWLLILGLGIFIELAQFLSPGRTPKLTDIRDDLLGAGLGWCVGGMVMGIARWIGARQRRRTAVSAVAKEATGDSRSDGL